MNIRFIMDRDIKKILKYFLNKGRNSSVEAHILVSDLGLKEKNIGNVLGACLSRNYLWYSPNARGSKYNQYGLSSLGLKAIDVELSNETKFKYVKIGIVLTICGIISTIIVGLQDKIFSLFQ